MNNGFFNVFESHGYDLGLEFNISYSSITDYYITVGYKSTHPDFKDGAEILTVQSCDFNLALAKAEIEFKEWLSENNGGY